MICPNCDHVFELPRPSWYDILHELSVEQRLKGLPVYEKTVSYVDGPLASLSAEELEDVAIAVSGQWGSKGWKWVNPYRVWQTWARMQIKRNLGSYSNVPEGLSKTEARLEAFKRAGEAHQAMIERDKGKWANE